MAEQMALNQLAFRTGCAVEVDPPLNFMCMWALPFRDGAGVGRVSQPPNPAVGIVPCRGGQPGVINISSTGCCFSAESI
jgi:hypothetical protein